jgi:hypothetical protein
MNVLNLDVHMDVLYIMCAKCADVIISAMLVILFSYNFFKAQANLRRLRMDRHRSTSIIYVGWVNHHRLSWLTYDGPSEPS